MESIANKITQPQQPAPGNNFRADCYVILAAMLLRAPTKALWDILQTIECDETVPEKINNALRELCMASGNRTLAAMESEFNRLFVGMGCGELVPYASWYREKKIQSLTLALVRRDLARLGIVKKVDNHEPEDHAGALCEIMALISRGSGNIAPGAQAEFFHRHIAPWMLNFFQDLQAAKNAVFYRKVGLFGSSLLTAEKDYLQYENNVPLSNEKRRSNK
jgi:TorA maturation chaperone TorD